jgi:hypothetical protein
MSFTEADVRDKLAANLAVLEDGLELVETEGHIRNEAGAAGFIDILARDRFGQFVVIELKKSDASARDAIHELYKYTTLLKQAHGLSATEVRTAIVSTDWHELRVPFSSFVKSVPFHVDGWELEVDDDGEPTRADAVTPLEEPEGLELCPKHMAFLYETEEGRDSALAQLEANISAVGIDEFLLLEQNYSGGDDAVIYPFVLYFVMPTVSPVERARLEERTGISVDPEEEEFSDGWFFEETLQGEITRTSLALFDELEIGYPDKFATHDDRWPVQRVIRHGRRFESEVLRPDPQLLALIRSESDRFSVKYKTVTSPRFEPSWRKMRADLEQPLMGAGSWEIGVQRYLDEVEAAGDATVGISIYSPTDILVSLCKFASQGNPLHFPTLEVLTDRADGDGMRVLIGSLEWDGATCPADPQDVFDEFFEGDFMNYAMTRHFNELWPDEERVAAAHGLSYGLYEVRPRAQPPERYRLSVSEDDTLVRTPLGEAENPPETLLQFFRTNSDYTDRLVEIFQTHSQGL